MGRTEMPKSWKIALILPFNKPGKDTNDAGNYRPTALTSHLHKWIKKILDDLPEHRGLFATYQSGLGNGHSTVDADVKLSNEIKKMCKMKY